MNTQKIIRLDASHTDAAVVTMAAAFQNDPAMAFMLPDSIARPARLRKLMRWMFTEHLARGLVLGTPRCDAITLWRPPGAMHLKAPLWHPDNLRFIPIFRQHVLRAIRLDDAIHAALPREETWLYLRLAAVRPDRQGKGLGGLAIRAGLAEAERLGVPCVLETATPENVGLYQRLGFAIRSEWDVPGKGPHFWTMTQGQDRA